MFTFKTKHFAVLVVALAVTVMGGSAFAQSGNQTMFLGEGVTKINMIQYVPNPTPAPGNPAGNNPTWEISDFLKKNVETTANGTNDSNIQQSSVLRMGTYGKSSLKGQVLSFEVVGGAIDRVFKTGDIVHTGGFTLTRGGYAGALSTVTGNYQPVRARRVQVGALRIDLASGIIDGVITASNDWAESHTGQVIGRDDIFTIDPVSVSLLDGVSGTTSSRSSRFDTLFVQNLQVKLAPNAATFLNTHFDLTGTAAFSGGMHVGWASIFTVGVPARELPDYRDWILNY